MSPLDRLLVLRQAADCAPQMRPANPVYASLGELFDLTVRQIVAHADYVPWRDEWTAAYHTALSVLDEANRLTSVT